jgi:hypothetical protein
LSTSSPLTPEDRAAIVEALDDPRFIALILELSRANEWAMKVVRFALYYYVERWHRLMNPDVDKSAAPVASR